LGRGAAGYAGVVGTLGLAVFNKNFRSWAFHDKYTVKAIKTTKIPYKNIKQIFEDAKMKIHQERASQKLFTQKKKK